jgi:predicted metal-dependent phosphoesterase TrpH
MSAFPLLTRLCRESYSPPQAVYEKLKKLGMALVTITDHDSIQACDNLRRHADFFVSEEVTCLMPSGTEAHVGVYDISERQHVEIQRRRDDLPRLVAYLGEQDIFFSAMHICSSLTGRREWDDFAWFADRFPAVETLNGHMPARNNRQATKFARWTRRSVVGGSDAHTLRSAGSAYTEIRGARNKEEFLAGLRMGFGTVRGESGGYWKLTRDVFLIAAAMMAEQPAGLLLAPLAVGIPIFTLVNQWQEKTFVRKWRRKLANEWGKSGGRAIVANPANASRDHETLA